MNLLYKIEIGGTENGEVQVCFSFNGNEMKTDTDFDELIGIGQELKNALKKIRKINFSAKQE